MFSCPGRTKTSLLIRGHHEIHEKEKKENKADFSPTFLIVLQTVAFQSSGWLPAYFEGRTQVSVPTSGQIRKMRV